jgi:hypothetical protein
VTTEGVAGCHVWLGVFLVSRACPHESNKLLEVTATRPLAPSIRNGSGALEMIEVSACPTEPVCAPGR